MISLCMTLVGKYKHICNVNYGLLTFKVTKIQFKKNHGTFFILVVYRNVITETNCTLPFTGLYSLD